MTQEEAAEIILDNKPFCLCWDCGGVGSQKDRNGKGFFIICRGCQGTKLQLSRRYRQAMELLKLSSMPPMPAEAEHVQAKVFDRVYRRVLNEMREKGVVVDQSVLAKLEEELKGGHRSSG
jgi:hypothetical protein